MATPGAVEAGVNGKFWLMLGFREGARLDISAEHRTCGGVSIKVVVGATVGE